MVDQNADTPTPDASMNTEKQNVVKNRDRAREESTVRKAQRRPARSGQFNPGAEEYTEVLPPGPAGTDSTVSHATATHHDRTRDDA